MTISFMNSICDLLQKLDNLYVIQSEQQAEIVQSICNHIVIIGMTMFYQQSWCSNVEVEEKEFLRGDDPAKIQVVTSSANYWKLKG